jgi:hypothetical protein
VPNCKIGSNLRQKTCRQNLEGRKNELGRLFLLRFLFRHRGINAHFTPTFSFVLELNNPINQGEQCIVTATTHILTGVNFGSPLTHNNAASGDGLTTKAFDA